MLGDGRYKDGCLQSRVLQNVQSDKSTVQHILSDNS